MASLSPCRSSFSVCVHKQKCIFLSRSIVMSCPIVCGWVSNDLIEEYLTLPPRGATSHQTNTTTILKEYYPGLNRLMYGVVGGNYEPDKHESALQVCCGGAMFRALLKLHLRVRGLRGEKYPWILRRDGKHCLKGKRNMITKRLHVLKLNIDS